MDNPVKGYIEDRLFFPVMMNMVKVMSVFIKISRSELSDNFIPFIPSKDYKFAYVDNYF